MARRGTGQGVDPAIVETGTGVEIDIEIARGPGLAIGTGIGMRTDTGIGIGVTGISTAQGVASVVTGIVARKNRQRLTLARDVGGIGAARHVNGMTGGEAGRRMKGVTGKEAGHRMFHGTEKAAVKVIIKKGDLGKSTRYHIEMNYHRQE